MAAFRFRAAAALDVRRRQEDEAGAMLARAEGRLSAARTALASARARVDEAHAALAETARAGADAETWRWHRNWMVRLTAAVEGSIQQVERSTASTEAARQVWFAARRKRLMLERLRDRAWQRHRLAEQRQDIKQMDELARARYVTPPVGAERSQE